MPDTYAPDSAAADLEVAAHTLMLPRGTFCIHVVEVSPGVERDRLPGLSITAAPGEEGDAIDVARLRGEPWLRFLGDAVLVRVRAERVRLLLTSYNLVRAAGAIPPKIHVQQLDTPVAVPLQPSAAPAATPVMVHICKRGDIHGRFGDWLGDDRPEMWIEGFSIEPPPGLTANDLEYQALLGKGWFSPWVAAGGFCGSRGMQLPVLGYRVRLKGTAATQYRCTYSATFADGSRSAPTADGEVCAQKDFSPMLKMQIAVEPLPAASPSTQALPIAAGASSTAAPPTPSTPVPQSAKTRRGAEAAVARSSASKGRSSTTRR